MGKVAARVEELGFDSVWVHDHTAWTRDMHRRHISSGAAEALVEKQTPDFFEPLTTLSYLAALTKKVRLGVAVMVVPLKNPIYAAKQTANLDVISNGRLILGVGIGSPATMQSRDYEIFGVNRKERGRIADEYIEAMRTIWTTPLSTFRGKYVSFENAEIYPKPVQKPYPPIWVGGWKKGAIERAAKLGDGWIPGWFTPAELKQRLKLLYERAEFYGRSGRKIEIGQEMVTSFAKTDEEAKRNAAPTVKAGLKTYERELTVEGYMARSLIGGPSQMMRQVESFVEAGVTHFELRPVYSTIKQLIDMMALWSKEILPAYK